MPVLPLKGLALHWRSELDQDSMSDRSRPRTAADRPLAQSTAVNVKLFRVNGLLMVGCIWLCWVARGHSIWVATCAGGCSRLERWSSAFVEADCLTLRSLLGQRRTLEGHWCKDPDLWLNNKDYAMHLSGDEWIQMSMNSSWAGKQAKIVPAAVRVHNMLNNSKSRIAV